MLNEMMKVTFFYTKNEESQRGAPTNLTNDRVVTGMSPIRSNWNNKKGKEEWLYV
jgi:hypothetical protein